MPLPKVALLSVSLHVHARHRNDIRSKGDSCINYLSTFPPSTPTKAEGARICITVLNNSKEHHLLFNASISFTDWVYVIK